MVGFSGCEEDDELCHCPTADLSENGRRVIVCRVHHPEPSFRRRRRLRYHNEYDGQGLQDLDENDFDGDTNLSNDEEYED